MKKGNKPDYVVHNPETGRYDSFLRVYQTSVSGPKIEIRDLTPFKQSSLAKAHHRFDKRAEEIRLKMEKLLEEFGDNDLVWTAEMSFEPNMGSEVYVYQKDEGTNFCSMISPSEWGNKFNFLGKFRLDTDCIWRKSED